MIMPASKQKQLNVRSDEAYQTAHDVAERLGTTTTEVVIQALREFKSSRQIPSRIVTVEQADANLAALLDSVRSRTLGRTAELSSDHAHLYDDFGLPK